MERYDFMVLLGSQVIKEGKRYILAPHTELKARAAGIAWQRGITKRFIISGGYNFGVRYSDTKILKNPNFSFEAFTQARKEKSEAEIIRDFMRDNYGVPEEAMILEELSATTQENMKALKILLERTTFAFAKKIAILTLAYHIGKALSVFEEEVELKVDPLFAEDLLALEGETGIEKVCQYYSTPKGGKQWAVVKIRELLRGGRSIREHE